MKKNLLALALVTFGAATPTYSLKAISRQEMFAGGAVGLVTAGAGIYYLWTKRTNAAISALLKNLSIAPGTGWFSHTEESQARLLVQLAEKITPAEFQAFSQARDRVRNAYKAGTPSQEQVAAVQHMNAVVAEIKAAYPYSAAKSVVASIGTGIGVVAAGFASAVYVEDAMNKAEAARVRAQIEAQDRAARDQYARDAAAQARRVPASGAGARLRGAAHAEPGASGADDDDHV